MVSTAQREELKKFLRAKRESAKAPSAGPRAQGRRRTPGLRREEVAVLAGVSATWYTWLEQGRDIRCSRALLARLSKALRLSRSDTDYLFQLAGHGAPIRKPRPGTIEPGVQSVLNGFTAGPALMFGPRFDVLAFNPLANAVFRIDSHTGPLAHNHLWRGFMDDARRKIYVDWADLMGQAVALLRTNYASRIGDPAFESLIATLRTESREFAGMWEKQQTIRLKGTNVRLVVPELGPLSFLSTRFEMAALEDHLAFFLCPVDEKTRIAMSIAANS